MTAKILKDRIDEICTHVTFTYRGKDCGVDPLSHTQFDIWYGDIYDTFDSIDKVMEMPFFDGKALKDIIDELEDIQL